MRRLLSIAASALVAQLAAQTPPPRQEAYDSWMLAKAGNVPGPEKIQVPPGFAVELLRVAAPDEDSWVGMTFDEKGRLIVAKETKGILRMTLEGAEVMRVERINDDLLECRGLLWAHDSLYVNANNSKGLYRLRDTDGDDLPDESRLLLHTKGGVGHGRNHLRLGPDGMIYAVHGDDPEPADSQLSPGSPYRNYGEDRLLPGRRPAGRTNVSRTGHVLRISADGSRVERLCGGLRNPLDVDFNRDGEMFVYDADLEWDTGLAWYRPTRVLHIVSGGEYGWRHELSWPQGAEDNLPAVCDIGLGSPTGVTFAHSAKFPPKFRGAFFIADWAYGRILAVHMQPKGASYTGAWETFAAGRPLNVTDLVIGPDGAMYFITGGRRTQSALYRVKYAGEGADEPLLPDDEGIEQRGLRRVIEKLHAGPAAGGTDVAFKHLAHPDRWIRFAARVALEAQPLTEWRERALASGIPGAWLAFARCTDDDGRFELLRRLAANDAAGMQPELRLQYLRAIELCIGRLGAVDKVVDAELEAALRRPLSAMFPTGDAQTDRELCRLLVWLNDDTVIGKALALLKPDIACEDASTLLFVLRLARHGWNDARRRAWFEALRRAEAFAGGRNYAELLVRTRAEFTARLGDAEKSALGELLDPQPPRSPSASPVAAAPARFVRAWQLADFAESLRQPLRGRDFASGRAAFSSAGCAACHRLGGNATTPGVVTGPELTAVGARFSPDALLLHTIEPGVVIDDKYRLPDAPNLSPMPAGLLNVLEAEQVLDLLAYLTAGGDPEHEVFKP